MKRSAWIVLSLALVLVTDAAAQSAAASPDLSALRAALDKYQDPVAAMRDGYFSTLGCVDFPAAGGAGQMQYQPGGMGVHFLNPSLIGPRLDSLRPQILIYEPDRRGRLTLVAAEWFAPTQVLPERPTLFGRPMDGPMEGHAPIMPAELHHWDLHVWLWKNNPAGMFSPTNPAVRCTDSYPYTFHETATRMVH